jgi:hypothetical protein
VCGIRHQKFRSDEVTKDKRALCCTEILKLIVNSVALFVEKMTGKQALTFVVEKQGLPYCDLL